MAPPAARDPGARSEKRGASELARPPSALRRLGRPAARQLRRPRCRAAPRAHAGAHRVRSARSAARARGRTRARLARAAGPQGRDQLVEVGAAERRRALDQVEPVRHEGHAGRRRTPAGRRRRPARRRSGRALAPARLEAHLEPVRAVLGLDVDLDARDLRRRSGPARARSTSGTTAPCSRSRAPRAGSSCRRRSGRGRR